MQAMVRRADAHEVNGHISDARCCPDLDDHVLTRTLIRDGEGAGLPRVPAVLCQREGVQLCEIFDCQIESAADQTAADRGVVKLKEIMSAAGKNSRSCECSCVSL